MGGFALGMKTRGGSPERGLGFQAMLAHTSCHPRTQGLPVCVCVHLAIYLFF